MMLESAQALGQLSQYKQNIKALPDDTPAS